MEPDAAFLDATAQAELVRSGQASPLELVDAAIERNGLKILVLTRLSPIFPFVVLNYLFGLTRLPLLPSKQGVACFPNCETRIIHLEQPK